MPSDPTHKTYKTIRLPYVNYDEPGVYSLTLVAHDRRCIFGEIVDNESRLNPIGEIVREEWLRSAEMRSALTLDYFVIMPNHLHGLVLLSGTLPSARSAALRPTLARRKNERPPASISSFMAGFKASVTRRIREQLRNPVFQVWQPRFHDHVVRADGDLNAIRQYIQNNPQQWALDEENPDRQP